MSKLAESTAIGYIRVSTKRQADSGHSLKAQERRIREYCKAENIDCEIEPDKGYSGMEYEGRLGLQKVLRTIQQKNVQQLIVTSLDRLSRKPYDLGRIIDACLENNVRIITLEDLFGEKRGLDSDEDLLAFGMLARAARWQRDRTSKSTKGSLDTMLKQGKATNHPLMGFDVDAENNLVPDESELRTVRRILELDEQGHSRKRIAEELNDKGLPSKHGGEWSHKTVGGVLKNVAKKGYKKLYRKALKGMGS